MDQNKSETRKGLTLGTPVWIVIVACALAVGVLCGYLGGSGSASGSSGSGQIADLAEKTTLAEDELDDVIATYEQGGSTLTVTAREVLEFSGSLDSQANDDGTYDIPSAEDVATYVRNRIVLQAAEDSGLTVSDDEVDAYAEGLFGTSDYATIADTYSIDEDSAKEQIADSALMAKLRDSVVTTEIADSVPTAPDEPEDDAEDTPTAEYAAYVIALLGDEWDSETGTWATTDGTYYDTLSGYEITNDSATYAAAYAAYTLAYNEYVTAYNQRSTEWTTYVNALLAGSSLTVGTLVV